MEPPGATPTDAERGLKKLDHEHDEYMKRMEQEWALRRDAMQFTKDYGLFTLRSCLVLNGGAILAMLAFIGNLYGHTTTTSSYPKLHDFSRAIAIFGLGLVATVIASICGYFNFLAAQRRLSDSFTLLKARSAMGMATPDYGGKWTRTGATGFGVAALVLFMAGVTCVICVLSSY
jgi:hypothetical protein